MNREEEERDYDIVELAEQLREDEERETRQQEAERAEEAERDRQRREELTALLTAQVTQPEVRPERAPEPPNGGRIMTDTINTGGIIHTINTAQETIEPVEARPLTQHVTFGAGWGQNTVYGYPSPRRYQFDFNKVNSIQDIAKVLEVYQELLHININEKMMEELGIKNLVKRIDDIN